METVGQFLDEGGQKGSTGQPGPLRGVSGGYA